MAHNELKVNPEFAALIPPLTDEERDGLERSILEEGVREPIITWRGWIVDGHNRYEIATKHGLDFDTTEYEFEDADAVKEWMILNQFARRNLSAYQRSVLALQLKPLLAKEAKERQLSGLKQFDTVQQNSAGRETRDELAAYAGVSHDTISKVEKIQRDGSDELRGQVERGEVSINEAYKRIRSEAKKAEIDEAQRLIAAQVVDNPRRPTLKIGSSIGVVHTCDLLLTDPPYSTDVYDIDAFARSWLFNALSGVRSTGFAYVFIGAYPKELRAYLNIEPPEHLELTQVLIWSYRNTLGVTPKDRYDQSYQACLFYRGVDAPNLNCPLTSEKWAVQEVNAPGGITLNSTGDKRYHSWQKPMELAERFIRHSTEQGDDVYDPFACTGTFLLAAAKLGRNAFGYEINPDNAQIAYSRGCCRG